MMSIVEIQVSRTCFDIYTETCGKETKTVCKRVCMCVRDERDIPRINSEVICSPKMMLSC